MKKDVIIFGSVTVFSMVVAAVGHALYPPFCVAVKPMAWPLMTLLTLLVRRAVIAHRKAR